MPARNTCARKSGVVSITMLRSPVEIRMEGRSRLSRGSAEWHTAQEQPMVGTPELVPDPSTVILIGIAQDLAARRRASLSHSTGLMQPVYDRVSRQPPWRTCRGDRMLHWTHPPNHRKCSRIIQPPQVP